MKVKMKKNLVHYSGKADGLLFYYHSGINSMLARRKPNMPHQPINDRYKKISKALKAINPSAAYRADFKAYLEELKKGSEEITMISWHNLFIKMMWSLAAKYPGVNLETITRQQIIDENLPCRSIKTAVEAGLIQMAGGYKKFTAQI